jgi:hypothetical protein
MGPRFVFTALTFAFGLALVFATLTTLHQVSTHASGAKRDTKLRLSMIEVLPCDTSRAATMNFSVGGPSLS